MTKGTKAFRITICILLGLTMLWNLFFTTIFFLSISKESYGVSVAGVRVTRSNKDDVLGDGTVSYEPAGSKLTLKNANIEYDYAIIYSTVDLEINLIGENRFLCKDLEYITAIYVKDVYLYKDLYISGDGSLKIEFQNVTQDAQGILAANLTVMADVHLTTPDCPGVVNGIVCDSSLYVGNGASLTVKNGSGMHSSAVRVRGNAFFEGGTSLDIAVNPGTELSCKGLSINGDLILAENMSMNVSIDDALAETGDCIRVTGVMDVGEGTTVRAVSKNAYGIECFGTIKVGKNASVSADTSREDVDIFCYGAIVNRGVIADSEAEALGGIHND